jgi:hypothetical protein
VQIVLLKLHVNRYLLHIIEFNNHQSKHNQPNQSHLAWQGGSRLALIHEVTNEEVDRETEYYNLVSVKSSGQIPGQYH